MNKVKGMKATHFQLDLVTHKRLRIGAIEEGISMGEALRQAVEMWLVELEKRRSRKNLKED
jgi:hypothetical protein